jgi:hypothetical protein
LEIKKCSTKKRKNLIFNKGKLKVLKEILFSPPEGQKIFIAFRRIFRKFVYIFYFFLTEMLRNRIVHNSFITEHLKTSSLLLPIPRFFWLLPLNHLQVFTFISSTTLTNIYCHRLIIIYYILWSASYLRNSPSYVSEQRW